MDDHIPNSIEHAIKWWQELEQRRGERAQLRRCKSLYDVLLCQGFYRLLDGVQHNHQNAQRLALVAGVLAHVKTNVSDSHTLGHWFGVSGKGEQKAAMSGLRFRRLMANPTHEDVYRPLIQSLALIQYKAHIPTLFDDLYFWDAEHRFGTRYRWTREYYRNALDEA